MGKKVKFERAKSTSEGKKKGMPCKMLITHIPSWQSKENNIPRPEASVLGQEATLGYCYREGYNEILFFLNPSHTIQFAKTGWKGVSYVYDHAQQRISTIPTPSFHWVCTEYCKVVGGQLVIQLCYESATCPPFKEALGSCKQINKTTKIKYLPKSSLSLRRKNKVNNVRTTEATQISKRSRARRKWQGVWKGNITIVAI